MTLDKLPGTKIFVQRDVRETPASTATATAVGLTGEPYILAGAGGADLTAERVLTAGAGIDFDDGGAGTTFTINGEAASTTNAGIIEIATGAETNTGTDATRAVSPDALDDWTGSAQITTIAEAAVTAHEGAIDHDALTNFTADEHFTEASIDHTAITNIGTNSHSDIDTHIGGDGSDHSLLANKTSYLSIPPSAFEEKDPSGSVSMTYDGIGANGKHAINTSDSAYVFFAPVNLPHGAVITGAVVYGTSTGENWTLYRAQISDGDSEAALASAALGTEDTTISNGTIDNSTYFYFFETEAIDTSGEIYGARVKYTTDYI